MATVRIEVKDIPRANITWKKEGIEEIVKLVRDAGGVALSYPCDAWHMKMVAALQRRVHGRTVGIGSYKSHVRNRIFVWWRRG